MHTTMIPEMLNALAATVLAQDGTKVPAVIESPSLFGFMLKGGAVSYLLILLSILAVAMVIWNLIELRLSRLAPSHVMDGLGRLLAARNVDGAVQFCQQRENDSFISRVMATGLTRAAKSPFGMLEVRTKLEDAASRELEVLDRPTNIIGMLAAVGPMLGLLGTVIGLIGAFQALSGLEGAAKSNELSKFMSYALVATAEGLVLAIPCTFLYAIFKRRTTRLVGIVGQDAETLVAALQAPAPAAGPKAVPAAPVARAAAGTSAPAAVPVMAAKPG